MNAIRGLASPVALALVPVLACAAPAAQVAEGPVADAVRQGVASGKRSFDHGRWDGLLARHVDADGRVDYAGFQRDRFALEAYLAEVGGNEIASLRGAEILALLVNAYNACTVRLILDGAQGDRFPRTIRDLPDPWGRRSCTLAGKAVSLDTIEHGLLRPLFKDTRLHAALNCASRSCPLLVPWAYRGDRIEEQLQARMEAMVNSDAHVRFEKGHLRVSSIFKWYTGDFVDGSFRNGAPGLAEYLLRYARPELRRRLAPLGPSPSIDFLDYDWSLNGRSS